MTAATSSGSPIRRTAVASIIACFSRAPSSPSCVSAELSSGVSIGPGATALQRTPNRADSRAIAFVKPMTPAFAAEYVAEPCDPTRPASLATLTITPPPRSCIVPSTACVHASTPRRFTPSTKSHSASSVLTKNAKRSVPALLTSTSTGPNASPTAATARPTDAVSVTSSSVASPSISAATSRAASASRSPTATRAPSAARRRAVAAPMPPAPPVTSAVRPSRRMTANHILAALGRPGLHHRRLRRARVRSRRALGTRRHPRRDRLARRPPRGVGRPPGRGRGARRRLHRRRERGRRDARRGRRPHRPVSQPVRDADEPQGRPARGPARRRRDRPARRRGVGQGDPDARRLAGLGGRAGGRDGARRRARRERAAHGERRPARRPRPRARRGRAGLRRPQGRPPGRRRPRRPDRRAARRPRGSPRDGADRRVADAALDLDQRAPQDARRDQDHGSVMGAPVVVLAGGTGGAKLARGLLDVCGEDLVAIVNTGDDVEMHGAYVSPDPDLVTFWLADRIDERGWGLRDDTFHAMDQLRELGVDVWFNLGDRDLAIGLHRAERLRTGATLTTALAELGAALGVKARVLPMADRPVRTRVLARGAWHDFQTFMIRERGAGPVDGVEYAGVEAASPPAAALEAIAAARAIVIGPSNPVISIRPILAVPGMANALASSAAPVVAVSPVVGGAIVKGPTEPFMAWLRQPLSAAGVAAAYGGLVDGMVADEPVEGMAHLVTDTLMADAAARRRVAAETLRFAETLTR